MYVGPLGTTVENSSSRIVVARHNGTTVLTMANDATADTASFAMLVPVPHPIDASHVKVVDRSVIDAVDLYTSPRVVAYSCEDLYGYDYDYGDGDYYISDSGSETESEGCNLSGCASAVTEATEDAAWASSTSGAAAGGGGGTLYDAAQQALDSVEVHAEFAVGDYEMVVLSADESLGLMLWLDQEGYEAPRGGRKLLQEYLDQGTYFFAVKVDLEAAPEGEFLDPIQLTYEDLSGDTWELPTQLGALNATGMQEVTLFTLTDTGTTFLQNLEQVTPEQECMPMLEEDETLDGFYAEWLDQQFEDHYPGGYIEEYAWPLTQKCDPCPPGASDTLDPSVVDALGGSTSDYVTRLRIRYEAESAHDLALSTLPGGTTSQIRFVSHEPELESDFPLCMGVEVEEPGSCEDTYRAPPPKRRAPGGQSGLLGVALLLAAGLWRRRED
jgi:hypothetical protein